MISHLTSSPMKDVTLMWHRQDLVFHWKPSVIIPIKAWRDRWLECDQSQAF